MKKRQKNLCPYVLACVIFVLSCFACMRLPETFLKGQDAKRLDQRQVEHVRRVAVTAQTDMSITEKVNLLGSANTSNLEMINGRHYTMESVWEKAEEEFHLLSREGILPSEFAGTIWSGDCRVMFVMDLEDSERSMTVWTGNARTDRFSLEWMMDDESGKILGFYVRDTSFETIKGKSKISQSAQDTDLSSILEGWATYLGCEADTVVRLDVLPEEIHVQESYVETWSSNSIFSEYQDLLGKYGLHIEDVYALCMLLKDEKGSARYWGCEAEDGAYAVWYSFFCYENKALTEGYVFDATGR